MPPMTRAAPTLLATLLFLLAAPARAGLHCSSDSLLLQARAVVTQSPADAPDDALERLPPAPVQSPHEGRVRVEHSFLGCFPRSEGDADDAVSFNDATCVNASEHSQDAPCRSGLPFYRILLQPEQSYLDCFTFCLSKGLDLSGLLRSERGGLSECRCGATAENKGAWHEGSPPTGLTLRKDSRVSEDDERCKLLVWRYTGPLEDDAVPAVLLQRSTTDEAYVDGVATQRDPRTIKEEDEQATQTAAAKTIEALQVGAALNATSLLAVKTRGVCEDLPPAQNGVGQQCSNLKAYCNNQDQLGVTVRSNCPMSCAVPGCQLYQPMPCYPHACGPGGGPWTLTGDGQRLAAAKVGGNVYINYYFDSIIDSKRRAVFDLAKREWESKTCLRFVERASSPAIKVTITNYDTCSAGVGFPGTNNNVDLNLGWCNDNNHFGSVVHEMGHAIGMNHEQNRPDGAQQGYTAGGYQGPYLNVKWYNIDSAWRPQWQGQKRSYTGSITAGYAYYDYQSIMHYGLGDSADATNPEWQNVPGQRSELSEGDVRQVNDMYQCAVR